MTRRIDPTILATCVIPWDENYRFLEPEFRRHLQLIARTITRHVYLFGTAGEGYAVTDDQFRGIAQVFADESNRIGLRPMLGVISLSLGTIISRIELGRSLGVREFQLSFPRWGVVTEHERDVFFHETCGRFDDCQFLHYNTVRGRAGPDGCGLRAPGRGAPEPGSRQVQLVRQGEGHRARFRRSTNTVLFY